MKTITLTATLLGVFSKKELVSVGAACSSEPAGKLNRFSKAQLAQMLEGVEAPLASLPEMLQEMLSDERQASIAAAVGAVLDSPAPAPAVWSDLPDAPPSSEDVLARNARLDDAQLEVQGLEPVFPAPEAAALNDDFDALPPVLSTPEADRDCEERGPATLGSAALAATLGGGGAASVEVVAAAPSSKRAKSADPLSRLMEALRKVTLEGGARVCAGKNLPGTLEEHCAWVQARAAKFGAMVVTLRGAAHRGKLYVHVLGGRHEEVGRVLAGALDACYGPAGQRPDVHCSSPSSAAA